MNQESRIHIIKQRRQNTEYIMKNTENTTQNTVYRIKPNYHGRKDNKYIIM